MCGYAEPVQGAKVSNKMQRYVNKANPTTVAVFNSEDDEIKHPGPDGKGEVVWIEESKFLKQQAEQAAKVPATPVKPAGK